MKSRVVSTSRALKGFSKSTKEGAAIHRALRDLGLASIADGLLFWLAGDVRLTYARTQVRPRQPYRRKAAKLARELSAVLRESGQSWRYTTSNRDIRALALVQQGITEAAARKHGLLINTKNQQPSAVILLHEYLTAFADLLLQVEKDSTPANPSGRRLDARTFVIRRVKLTLLDAMKSVGVVERRRGVNTATARIAAVLLDSPVSANTVTQAFRGTKNKKFRKPQLPREE